VKAEDRKRRKKDLTRTGSLSELKRLVVPMKLDKIC
jgi:hypothetical protein